MKKMFVLVALVFFAGCAIDKPAFHLKMPADSVYIDKDNTWYNGCVSTCSSPWRAITVSVLNSKYRDATVTVKCFYSPNMLFGEQTKVVEARNGSTFFIRGLSRGSVGPENVNCQITNVI